MNKKLIEKDSQEGKELQPISELGTSQENQDTARIKVEKKSGNWLNFVIPIGIAILIMVLGYYISLNKSPKNNIILIKVKNYDEMSIEAGKIMEKIIKKNPNASLGLATGSSPIGLYKYLIEKNKAKEISFKNIKTFNLDEYCDLPVEHSESYYSFMHKNLFDSIDIDPSNTHLPRGLGNLQQNCDDYNKLLANNKVDIQLLGIGSNGHIGFNEPLTPFNMTTHIVNLTPNTRNDNKRFFNGNIDEVPKQAITMGIKNILDAKKILLVASGKNKAQAIKTLIEGEIDPQVPATSLRTFKGDVYIVADEDACELLSKK